MRIRNLFIFMALLPDSMIAQTMGIVIDSKNTPIEYVNIAMYSLPDSTFISGTVTNETGAFSLTCSPQKKSFLKISMIGFETETITNINNGNIGTIVLQESSQLLNEVVVKGTQQIYKMETDGLVSKVENSVLSHLGTANDVLAQLPFINSKGENLSVFGRGTPLIYLNNRLVRDMEELNKLSSSDIKEVKVILNPGSQYDATIGSVIRITTIKPVGEGLSGSVRAFFRQRRKFDQDEYLDLNYRKGKLDLFGKVSYDKLAYKQNQKGDASISLEENYSTHEEKQINASSYTWEATAGANYAFLPTHLFGFRYVYTSTPGDEWLFSGETNHSVNEANDDNYIFQNTFERKTHRHYLNMYYHNELKDKTIIHFEGDFLKGGGTSSQTSDFHNQNDQSNIVAYYNNPSDYSLYAGKLTIDRPLLGGDFSIGGEGSYTDNEQSVAVVNSDASIDLTDTEDESKQLLLAGFATFDYTWGKFYASAGIRYEYIDFKYYNNGMLSDEQSRTYNNWLPTFSLSYNDKKINMSLGYKTIVNRPNYYNLRSAVSYNSPYDYEGGNPSLKSMFTHKLSYSLGWNDLQLSISYNWIKDQLLFVGDQYKTEPIILFSMKNLSNSRFFDAYINYSPGIRFWKPAFSIGFSKQHLKYNGLTYNKPYFNYKWNNIFTLPKGYQFVLNMSGNLRGNNGVTLDRSTFRTDARINKNFFNKKLNVQLSATDIFGTYRETWLMNTGAVKNEKWNDMDLQGVNLRFLYKFNASGSKYKGKGATKEVNRM